jgi:hypothetical protein
MRKHTELTVPLKKSRLTGVQRLSNKEQICDVRERLGSQQAFACAKKVDKRLLSHLFLRFAVRRGYSSVGRASRSQ